MKCRFTRARLVCRAISPERHRLQTRTLPPVVLTLGLSAFVALSFELLGQRGVLQDASAPIDGRGIGAVAMRAVEHLPDPSAAVNSTRYGCPTAGRGADISHRR
jgi:hypothetical protein